ncbi:hypothetical protein [Rufibacter latericius]|uniref:Uncharacterized protein n=1 Tax=Rufibacter latericius TaxID=2487040 RepID=A0A3M9MAM5_9BACT|nr:hypothetical protein [Rufibacter latericius]RNI22601.1 hypothetical protein EFB08_21130 [Rufibacter latericius]
MKREAKQFITWGKERRKLVSLDIKNSQPYLLLGLLHGKLYGLDSGFVEALNDLRKSGKEMPSLADLKSDLKLFNGSVNSFLGRLTMINDITSTKKSSSKAVSMSFNAPFSLKCLHNDYLKVIEHIFLRSSTSRSYDISSSIM